MSRYVVYHGTDCCSTLKHNNIVFMDKMLHRILGNQSFFIIVNLFPITHFYLKRYGIISILYCPPSHTKDFVLFFKGMKITVDAHHRYFKTFFQFFKRYTTFFKNPFQYLLTSFFNKHISQPFVFHNNL